MLISPDYVKLNRQLHQDREDYGNNGKRWAEEVMQAAEAIGTKDILDYGCGKASLAKALPQYQFKNYDPAIPQYAHPPAPADIVVCTDVLEHIEPNSLDDVLDDIRSKTKKVVLLVVATREAVKTLPDGRNTHLIVEPYAWWLPKLWERFAMDSVFNFQEKEFQFWGRPHGQ